MNGPPPVMEWTRAKSPWSPVPVAAPLWSRFTGEEHQALAEGGTVRRGGTSWRIPAADLPSRLQLALF